MVAGYKSTTDLTEKGNYIQIKQIADGYIIKMDRVNNLFNLVRIPQKHISL